MRPDAAVAMVFLAVGLVGVLLFALGSQPNDAHAAFLNEAKKLVASDAVAEDQFGFTIALDGDTALVSAWDSDAGTGSVYVLERNAGGTDNWGEVKKITASDGQAGDMFGVDVGLSGETAIVGAYYEDGAGYRAGAAYIFERSLGGMGNWGEVKKITGSATDTEDWFAIAVAISGATAIVGAPGDDPGGIRAGAAYVFQRNQGGVDNWGEVKKLVSSDAGSGDNFGGAVTIDGDTAVVGAHIEDATAVSAGAAYVFQRDQGGTDQWGETKKLIASDAEDHELFGTDLVLGGDTLVVGAIYESSVAYRNGAAYVLERDQGGTDNWGEVKKLVASDAGDSDWFGEGLAISGDNVVVGARLEDSGGFGSGAAYAFQRNAGGSNNWGEVSKLTASDADRQGDDFGTGVGVNTDVALVGSRLEDSQGNNAGATYVFDLTFPKPTLTPTDTATPTPTPTDSPTPTNTPTPTPTSPKLPEPGDTDGDGCSDQRENGSDETLGGQRDFKNPWDFYDVLGPFASPPRDGIVDLPNDILTILLSFSPTGAFPYNVLYDRGPSSGPNPWNMTAPDGVIDLPNDILGVILQHNHSCV